MQALGGGYYGGRKGIKSAKNNYDSYRDQGAGGGGSGYVQGMKGCIDLKGYAFTGSDTKESYGNYVFAIASMQTGASTSAKAKIQFLKE